MVRIMCEKCGRMFNRSNRRNNEAIKNKWRQFCSISCQAQAKSTKVTRACCNPLCAKEINTRKKNGLAFCSLKCNAIYKNTIRFSSMELVPCAFSTCGKYITGKNSKYCSNKCARKSRKNISSYTPQNLTDTIKQFYNSHLRIPIKSEIGHLNRPARYFFGTWNNLIKSAGFVPNPVMFSHKYIANDGHNCDSLSEKIVDDWLFTKKIPHLTKVRYPWNNGMTADFKVEECWIEFFGLCGQLKNYDKLMKIKLQKVKEYKLNLISLFNSDIFPHNRLDKKLNILRK